jgi:hypothetical protein
MAPIAAPAAAPPNPPVTVRCWVADMSAQPVILMSNAANTKIANVFMFHSPLLLINYKAIFQPEI